MGKLLICSYDHALKEDQSSSVCSKLLPLSFVGALYCDKLLFKPSTVILCTSRQPVFCLISVVIYYFMGGCHCTLPGL